MSLTATVKESKLQRRMYTQKALWYRHNGDREECGYALICPESKY